MERLTDFLHWLDPGWVEALATVGALPAVAIAAFTYQRNGWDRKVAVARLVWATTGPAIGYSEGARFRPNRELFPPSLPDYGAPSTFFEHRHDPDSGEIAYVVSRPFTLVKVSITNNSDEPISNVSLTLRLRDDNLNYSPRAFAVVPPGVTKSVKVYADITYEHRRLRATRVALRFTDSAGHRWERIGTAPPKPRPKPERVRFPRLVAWKNRRVMQIRALSRRHTDDETADSAS